MTVSAMGYSAFSKSHDDDDILSSMQICIHRMLNHKNIIRFYGYRKASEVEYLFLKYASGGELFDRIGKHLLRIV